MTDRDMPDPEDDFDFRSPEPVKIEPSAEREPCPMCGELIALADPTCRHCGENLNGPQSVMEGRTRDRDAVSVKWFRRHVCGLGVLWIAVSIVLLREVIPKFFKFVAGVQQYDSVTGLMLIVLAIATVPSFVFGLMALLKRHWAIYGCLALAYIGVASQLVRFSATPIEGTLGIIVCLAIVAESHYVVSKARWLLHNGIPLTAKPEDFN